MTVPVQTPFTSSVANGVTTVFPYSFMIADEDDLKVVVDGVVQTTGYTVSGVGIPSGGNVTFAVAPANNLTVLRYLDPILKREIDYQQFGDLLSDTINLDFDKVWLALQALQQNFKRSLKLPIDTATDQTVSEDAAARVGLVVSFDASGNMMLAAPADLSLQTVSTFIATLLDDLNAASARATLGAEAADANIIKANATKALSAGYRATPYNAGTKSSGTFTPDEANGNQQYCTNGGAFTLAPPTNATSIILEVLNNGSAGAITTSGFTKVTGSFTTTNGHKFVCNIVKTQSYSLLQIQALQ